jgi:hypothetical protein
MKLLFNPTGIITIIFIIICSIIAIPCFITGCDTVNNTYCNSNYIRVNAYVSGYKVTNNYIKVYQNYQYQNTNRSCLHKVYTDDKSKNSDDGVDILSKVESRHPIGQKYHQLLTKNPIHCVDLDYDDPNARFIVGIIFFTFDSLFFIILFIFGIDITNDKIIVSTNETNV